MQKQKCGDCKHWHELDHSGSAPVGRCDFPIPEVPHSYKAARYGLQKSPTYEYEGGNCPCFESKIASVNTDNTDQ